MLVICVYQSNEIFKTKECVIESLTQSLTEI